MKFFGTLQLGAFGLLITLAITTACTTNPVSEAQTFEQKAYALYGVYVISQGKAAALYADPAMPENVKEALKQGNNATYPVAESLVTAATEVADVRAILEQCPAAPEPDPTCVPTNEQRLANAISNLSTIYFRAQPLILQFIAAVKGAKSNG